jgi:DNA-binding NarL/FixJ family response regulator
LAAPPLDIVSRAARSADSLSRREAAVAALIAQGRTNREIAAKLGISRRTAETHAARILHKLGLTSRFEVTRRLRSA